MRGFMQTLRSDVNRNGFNNNFIRQMHARILSSKNACLRWWFFCLRIPVDRHRQKKRETLNKLSQDTLLFRRLQRLALRFCLNIPPRCSNCDLEVSAHHIFQVEFFFFFFPLRAIWCSRKLPVQNYLTTSWDEELIHSQCHYRVNEFKTQIRQLHKTGSSFCWYMSSNSGWEVDIAWLL